jgi:plastocyanin
MRSIINRTEIIVTFRAMLIAVFAALAVPAAAQQPQVAIAIRDAGFAPAEVQVPAGTKIELSITNEQKGAAEFESQALRREKVIPPGATATVYIGPLQPGRYEFFDDFRPTHRGFVVAK